MHCESYAIKAAKVGLPEAALYEEFNIQLRYNALTQDVAAPSVQSATSTDDVNAYNNS